MPRYEKDGEQRLERYEQHEVCLRLPSERQRVRIRKG
jgi:hypothetical protein